MGSATVDIPAPPEEGSPSGGGDRGWVVLARARNEIEAHLLMGMLEEAGIETQALKDRNVPGAWLHAGSNPLAPVTVYVRKWQHDDARIVLAETAFRAPGYERVRPETAGWVVPVVWWTAALVLGMLFTGIALVRTAQSFERCGFRPFCSSTP